VRAADGVRAADPFGRPVFASTSDLPLIQGRPWSQLWASTGADLASLHTYDADLDQAVIARVRAAVAWTDKPIFLGESGLDANAPDGTTLTSAASAPIGLQSAIWAELFSGSATVRALYWEDGYAVYYPPTGLPLVTARTHLERAAADWLADKDFRDFVLHDVNGRPDMPCTAVGSSDRLLGWARNPQLVAPSWDAPPLDQAEIGVVTAGAADGPWTVTLTAPDDGSTTAVAGTAQGGVLTFTVPSPFNHVVFDASRTP
jgi:hypothetical protein